MKLFAIVFVLSLLTCSISTAEEQLEGGLTMTRKFSFFVFRLIVVHFILPFIFLEWSKKCKDYFAKYPEAKEKEFQVSGYCASYVCQKYSKVQTGMRIDE